MKRASRLWGSVNSCAIVGQMATRACQWSCPGNLRRRDNEDHCFRGVRIGLRCRLALAVAAVACQLVSCSGNPVAVPRSQRLQVATTVLPVTLFTLAIAGDCADVTPLIPPQSGPHDLPITPAALAVLQRARVLVQNGLGLDTFLDRLMASAGNPQLRIIDSSRGVATLSDGSEPRHAHNVGRETSRAGVNPHIWLDPRRAMQQVQSIRDGLIAADPSCAAGYSQRAQQFIAELRKLDAKLEQKLKPYRGKTLVVLHDVSPYFAQRYQLRQAFLVRIPELNPTPQDMQRVSRIIQQAGVKSILTEPGQSKQSVMALAHDLGLSIGVFDPLETSTAQLARDPQTYIAVMQANAAAVTAAFQP